MSIGYFLQAYTYNASNTLFLPGTAALNRITRFLMKLFNTSSIDVINDCRTNFSFMLPSEMIEIRKAKFEIKFNTCNSLRYYFGL